MTTVMPELQKQEVRKDTPRTVCFVCTGNTCRSPMAAAVYNDLHAGENVRAVSCGIAAHEGDPIHPNAVAALRAEGIPCTPNNNYEAHMARMATPELLSGCDRIWCLSPSHLRTLLFAMPELAGKLALLGDIPDPFGGDVDLYRETLRRIREALRDSE